MRLPTTTIWQDERYFTEYEKGKIEELEKKFLKEMGILENLVVAKSAPETLVQDALVCAGVSLIGQNGAEKMLEDWKFNEKRFTALNELFPQLSETCGEIKLGLERFAKDRAEGAQSLSKLEIVDFMADTRDGTSIRVLISQPF